MNAAIPILLLLVFAVVVFHVARPKVVYLCRFCLGKGCAECDWEGTE